MRNRLKAAEDTRADLKRQLEDLRNSIEDEKSARPETVRPLSGLVSVAEPVLFSFSGFQEERTAALHELADAKAKLSELQAELAQYGACDPKQVEEKKRAVALAHEAAIRWTGTFRYFSE